MQIIDLELQHFNFYCPATGECILKEDEPCNDDAKSLQAYWIDEVMEEPMIKNKKLAADWKRFYARHRKDYQSDFDVLEDFFRQYEQPAWVVFKLTNSGMGCGGPTSMTVWKVLDLNTVI